MPQERAQGEEHRQDENRQGMARGQWRGGDHGALLLLMRGTESETWETSTGRTILPQIGMNGMSRKNQLSFH